jgi:hypothetical protein
VLYITSSNDYFFIFLWGGRGGGGGGGLCVFCSVLLRHECCTFSNGEYVKSGLAELEKWIVSATQEITTISIL